MIGIQDWDRPNLSIILNILKMTIKISKCIFLWIRDTKFSTRTYPFQRICFNKIVSIVEYFQISCKNYIVPSRLEYSNFFTYFSLLYKKKIIIIISGWFTVYYYESNRIHTKKPTIYQTEMALFWRRKNTIFQWKVLLSDKNATFQYKKPQYVHRRL